MSTDSQSITFTVDGYDESRVTAFLVQKLSETFAAEVRGKVFERIEVRVASELDNVLNGRVEAAVQTVLDQGFAKTDEWGQPKGQRVTLAERIAESLKAKETSGYGRDSITGVAREAIEKAVAAEMASYGKARVREIVDATITAKLQQTLKESLGLR